MLWSECIYHFMRPLRQTACKNGLYYYKLNLALPCVCVYQSTRQCPSEYVAVHINESKKDGAWGLLWNKFRKTASGSEACFHCFHCWFYWCLCFAVLVFLCISLNSGTGVCCRWDSYSFCTWTYSPIVIKLVLTLANAEWGYEIWRVKKKQAIISMLYPSVFGHCPGL